MQDGRNSTLPQRHSQGLMALLLCLLLCVYFDLQDHHKSSNGSTGSHTKNSIASRNGVHSLDNKGHKSGNQTLILTDEISTKRRSKNSLVNMATKHEFEQIVNTSIMSEVEPDVRKLVTVISYNFNTLHVCRQSSCVINQVHSLNR